jgi:lincosamide nucleotidyltransferase A/C/D/E
MTNSNESPEMKATDVVNLIKLLREHDIDVCIDGGWCVDALLGEQTRKHLDLDIVIAYADVEKLRSVLEGRGYQDVPRPDTRPCNFVMGDNLRHLIDIHTYATDRVNHPEQGEDYPLDSLHGAGFINGYPVKCISVEHLIQFHTGYELDENDYRDVKALCERFGMPIPVEYEKFAKEKY